MGIGTADDVDRKNSIFAEWLLLQHAKRFSGTMGGETWVVANWVLAALDG